MQEVVNFAKIKYSLLHVTFQQDFPQLDIPEQSEMSNWAVLQRKLCAKLNQNVQKHQL